MAKDEQQAEKSASPAEEEKAGEKGAKKKKGRKNIRDGIAHIHSTFNNTIVTITDVQGNVVAWSSAGAMGFKGSRKGTPFAAQRAADSAARKAMDHGMHTVQVFVPAVPSACGFEHQLDQGCHPHPAQRMPAAKAEKGVRQEVNRR